MNDKQVAQASEEDALHTEPCGLPDKRCRLCTDKVQEWVDVGADGTDVEMVNDFLQHGGHLVNCPDRVSAGIYLTLGG